MGGNIEARETAAVNESSLSSTVPFTYFSREQKRKRNFINLAASFIIYTAAFVIFYFVQERTSYKTPDNLILLGVFIFSLVIGGFLSKKYNITRIDNYEKILTKLYTSFLINLLVLILVLSFLRVPDLVRDFFFGVMFSAMVVEAYYFMIVIEKKIIQTGFVSIKRFRLNIL